MTERLPFDPEKIAGPPADPGPARRERARFGKLTDARELTVTEVATLIQKTLEERIPSPIRVIGEVSNLNIRNHWYFSLKDENAVLGCVAFASSARKFKFTPSDGQEVVATGHISHYPEQGRTQLYVTKLEPVGAGALELRFRALCDELRRLGYFEESRKRRVPLFPRRIAVITSATGAAVQDVIATAAGRCRAVGLLIVDVRVQGAGAAEEVARAIRRVNRDRAKLQVDAILVTRGGGSIEDLWSFNERIVADAVFASELPVAAAIGHESDTTVIELVADLRAATPTQAAMLLVPAATELARQVEHLRHRLASFLRRQIERLGERVDSLSRAEFLRNPRGLLVRAEERWRNAATSLRRSMRSRLSDESLCLARLSHRLEAIRPARVAREREQQVTVLFERLRHAIRDRSRLAPAINRLESGLRHGIERRLLTHRRDVDSRHRRLNSLEVHSVLRRGFSYTIGRSGELIRSIGDVTSGDPITTHVADGNIESTVDGSRKRGGAGVPAARAGRPLPQQLDLFSSSQ